MNDQIYDMITKGVQLAEVIIQTEGKIGNRPIDTFLVNSIECFFYLASAELCMV